MCNLYRPRQTASEIARLFETGRFAAVSDKTGNEAWPELAYPNRMAPIVRHGEAGQIEVAGIRVKELRRIAAALIAAFEGVKM